MGGGGEMTIALPEHKTARKSYRCFLCLQPIEPGSQYVRFDEPYVFGQPEAALSAMIHKACYHRAIISVEPELQQGSFQEQPVSELATSVAMRKRGSIKRLADVIEPAVNAGHVREMAQQIGVVRKNLQSRPVSRDGMLDLCSFLGAYPDDADQLTFAKDGDGWKLTWKTASGESVATWGCRSSRDFEGLRSRGIAGLNHALEQEAFGMIYRTERNRSA